MPVCVPITNRDTAAPSRATVVKGSFSTATSSSQTAIPALTDTLISYITLLPSTINASHTTYHLSSPATGHPHSLIHPTPDVIMRLG